MLRRKRGRRRGRPRLGRGRGLKGRGRGAGRRLQWAQAQRGAAAHSPAADTGSKRASRGGRHRMVRDTCNGRENSASTGGHGPRTAKRSTGAAVSEAEAASCSSRSRVAQAASRRHGGGHLPVARPGPAPPGPPAPPTPSQDHMPLLSAGLRRLPRERTALAMCTEDF